MRGGPGFTPRRRTSIRPLHGPPPARAEVTWAIPDPPAPGPKLAGMRNRIAFNFDLSTLGATAPDEVELISAPDPSTGKVQGRDGRAWLFDVQAQGAVLDGFRQGGIDLPIDWEHATQYRAPNGQAAPAAAWIERLDIRDGGSLWGRVKWTPRASDQVANREYRFLSPVFDYDPATGRILRLVSAGLVNKPNLPLQALNHEEIPMRSKLLTAAIIAALALKEDADDDTIAAAINTLKKDRDTATALNAEKTPSLDRYVPRADYDTQVSRATNAERALVDRNKADHDAAVDAAIKGALQAGKITPATEEYHRAACSDTGGLERFKAFVGAAPAVADPTDLDGKKPTGAATALNAEQKEACRLTGMAEADYLAALQASA